MKVNVIANWILPAFTAHLLRISWNLIEFSMVLTHLLHSMAQEKHCENFNIHSFTSNKLLFRGNSFRSLHRRSMIQFLCQMKWIERGKFFCLFSVKRRRIFDLYFLFTLGGARQFISLLPYLKYSLLSSNSPPALHSCITGGLAAYDNMTMRHTTDDNHHNSGLQLMTALLLSSSIHWLVIERYRSERFRDHLTRIETLHSTLERNENIIWLRIGKMISE